LRLVQIIVIGKKPGANRQEHQDQNPGNHTPASLGTVGRERQGQPYGGEGCRKADNGLPVPSHVVEMDLPSHFAPNGVDGKEREEKLDGVKDVQETLEHGPQGRPKPALDISGTAGFISSYVILEINGAVSI
jgi:hypothetical protein